MAKYKHGYITIPSGLRDSVNKALFKEGLGIDFFNILLKDQGKNLLYAAIASLSDWQWSIVNRVLKDKCTKEDAETTVTLLTKKPTRNACEKVKNDKIKKEKEKPPKTEQETKQETKK